MSPSSLLAQKLFVPRVLWLALLASQVLYAVLLVFEVVSGSGEADASLVPVLGFAALGAAATSFVVPRTMRSRAVERGSFPTHEIPDPGQPVGFRGAAPTIVTYVDPAEVVRQAFALGMTPFVAELALSEAVTVFGFVLGVLGHGTHTWAPFIAAGLILTALRVPNASRFLGPIEQHTGVRVPR